MLKILTFLLNLFTIFLGISFALLNSNIVTIDYYFGKGSVSVGMLVVIGVFLGVFLAAIPLGIKIIRLKSSLNNIKRSHSRLNSDLAETIVNPSKS
ncbi:MAG: LapA family protein [Pseudomonadota bacterium]|nr:LapA family protein [Pseudomonadota bacterium]